MERRTAAFSQCMLHTTTTTKMTIGLVAIKKDWDPIPKSKVWWRAIQANLAGNPELPHLTAGKMILRVYRLFPFFYIINSCPIRLLSKIKETKSSLQLGKSFLDVVFKTYMHITWSENQPNAGVKPSCIAFGTFWWTHSAFLLNPPFLFLRFVRGFKSAYRSQYVR